MGRDLRRERDVEVGTQSIVSWPDAMLLITN